MRQALLDDLAELKLALEDFVGAEERNAYEAFARVVGYLNLTPAEEEWLERQ